MIKASIKAVFHIVCDDSKDNIIIFCNKRRIPFKNTKDFRFFILHYYYTRQHHMNKGERYDAHNKKHF